MLIDKIKKLTHELGVSGDEMRVAAIAAEMIKEYTEDVTIFHLLKENKFSLKIIHNHQHVW